LRSRHCLCTRIEEALEAAMALGPTSRVLQDQGPETRAAVTIRARRCRGLIVRNSIATCALGAPIAERPRRVGIDHAVLTMLQARRGAAFGSSPLVCSIFSTAGKPKCSSNPSLTSDHGRGIDRTL